MRMLFSKIKENKDGSASLVVDYDEEVKLLIKKRYNRKRITKSLLEKFIIEGLSNAMELGNENNIS